MEIQGLSFIGFHRGKPGGPTFTVCDRVSRETLPGVFHSASTEDVALAGDRAWAAFKELSRISWTQRAEFLSAIAQNLELAADTLVPRYLAESGLPEPRARGELARTCGQIRFFARIISEGSWVEARLDKALPNRTPIPKPDMRAMKRPVGPVAVFGASNFPFAFSAAGGDTASALAAGCPVIVKAHPAHPGVSELVAHCVLDAAVATGMPDGIFSLLFDPGIDIGRELVMHERIAAVGFTGSKKGGLALVELAASRPRPIPVFAEMGSVNPTVLLPEAIKQSPDALADVLFGSLTMGMGQFCTNPGLILAVGPFEPFLAAMKARFESAKGGCFLTDGIAQTYERQVKVLREVDGVEVLSETPGGPALFICDHSVFVQNPVLAEEIFGPFGLVVRTKSPLELLQKLEGQLTVSFLGTDHDLEINQELVQEAEQLAGRILFNQVPTGLEVCDATVHGGPFPATSDGRSTSVGGWAIDRWTRLVCWQNAPQAVLPAALRDGNPLGIQRVVDGHLGVH